MSNGQSSKSSKLPLLVRSTPPISTNYRDYKNYLRHDFWYSCGYCTLSEAETVQAEFHIDHYEPQSSFQNPNDADVYDNLIWSCSVCNGNKSDWVLDDELKASGYRFLRPDLDDFSEHLELVGIRVNPKSTPGEWTEQALRLNRSSLRKLRKIRQDLHDAMTYVANGVRGLQNFSIDEIPPKNRYLILEAKEKLIQAGKIEASEKFEDLLKEVARFPQDQEEEEQQKSEWKNYLERVKANFPGKKLRGRDLPNKKIS